MSSTISTRITAGLAVIAAAAIALSGCGGSEPPTNAGGDHTGHGAAASSMTTPSGASSSTRTGMRFNDADVEFATMMYPHHAQAIEMARAIDGRGASAEVVRLGEEVERAQRPEMDAFTRLLSQWGRPAPSATLSHPMDGMATPAQMNELKALRGTEFDRQWLNLMMAHHRGAIAMAQTELARGIDPESRRLAEAIRTGQQAEIERMRALLPPS